jgi:hypothetical protein
VLKDDPVDKFDFEDLGKGGLDTGSSAGFMAVVEECDDD